MIAEVEGFVICANCMETNIPTRSNNTPFVSSFYFLFFQSKTSWQMVYKFVWHRLQALDL